MLARMQILAAIFGPLDWGHDGGSIESVKGAVFQQRPAYEVAVRDSAGVLSFFVEAANYHLIGVRSQVDSPMGMIDSITSYSAYRVFEGTPCRQRLS